MLIKLINVHLYGFVQLMVSGQHGAAGLTAQSRVLEVHRLPHESVEDTKMVANFAMEYLT